MKRSAWPRAVALVSLVAMLALVAASLGGIGTTDPPAPDELATPDQVILAPPGRADVRALGEGGCEAWAPDPATSVDCGLFDGDGDGETDMAWSVAETDSGWRVEVRRRADRSRWSLALAAGPNSAWSSVEAETADAGGGPGEELLVVFGLPGSGSIAVIELLDRTGVVARGDLDHGSAELTSDGLVTHEAQFLPDDPSCCPSQLLRRRITAEPGGPWRVVDETVVPSEPAQSPS